MKQSLPELVRAARVALAEAVRPELTSDHARSQLAGVLDILAKLERMVVWSPEALREQAALLRAGCQAFTARLAADGVTPPPLTTPPGSPDDSAEAQAHAAEEQVMQLTDWLFDPSTRVAEALRSDLDRILQQALRQALIVERKLIPLTDFTAMSTAASPSPKD
ncbi:hypothetical protein [Caenimonas aquaedulcis]|uniref:Uncharacterized protein n=1 Tax=Caenimonas aquaedulcis TaxID=2793270 RepID=A0A931MGH1_9BURK|nr:hypothetical protein [Caenimonas aquaedulcis]MBG9388038.1 hypothetical protein [Caenimonas aquaedulcis]